MQVRILSGVPNMKQLELAQLMIDEAIQFGRFPPGSKAVRVVIEKQLLTASIYLENGQKAVVSGLYAVKLKYAEDT